MEPINELVAVRKEKEEALRNMGIETYPQDRGPYTTTSDIETRFVGMSHDELEKNTETGVCCGKNHGFS